MASGAITSKVRTVCGLVIRQRSSPSSRSRPLPLARPRSFWACLMKFLTWGAKLLLETIYAKGAGYGFGFPAQLAGNLKDITEKQFSGFYGEAGNATSWLAIPSLARLVCGDSFRTRNLLLGKGGCIHQPAAEGTSGKPAGRTRDTGRAAQFRLRGAW